ncbi:MAG: hypothetical protein QOH97_5301 [Actinoplanes sp.]|jgi:hypothetical protein|nr:hypothetical protein [Actinoplanes sp.]
MSQRHLDVQRAETRERNRQQREAANRQVEERAQRVKKAWGMA